MKQSYRLLFTFSASLAAMAVIAGASLPTTPVWADPEPTETPPPEPEPTVSPSPSPSPTGALRKCCATIYQLQYCGAGSSLGSNDPDGRSTLMWQPGFGSAPHSPSQYTNRYGRRSINTNVGSLTTYVKTRAAPPGDDCNWDWTEAAVRSDAYECGGPGWTIMNKIYESEKHIADVYEPHHELECEKEWEKEPWVKIYTEGNYGI